MNSDPEEQSMRLIEGWPECDASLWKSARTPASVLDEAGRAAKWRPSTVRLGLEAYDSWLAWLKKRGELSLSEGPAMRITKPRIAAYIEHLRSRQLADITVAMSLHHLCYTAKALHDGADLKWLARIARRLAAKAKPVRPKVPRLVDVVELYQLGVTLMEQACSEGGRMPRNAAVIYRDGVMLAMWAARPLRLGECLSLGIGTTIRKEGDRYVARLGAEARKSKRSLEVPYPVDLTPAIDTYISSVRPILARANRVEEIETDSLWLSREGRRISACNVNHRVRKLTLTYLGRDLCPHLIRDCAATSIATKAPKDVGITRNILGHATLRMSEQHYNHANMVSALQRLHSIVLEDWTETPSEAEPN
jgi:integrase/recombinase XerD